LCAVFQKKSAQGIAEPTREIALIKQRLAEAGRDVCHDDRVLLFYAWPSLTLLSFALQSNSPSLEEEASLRQ
jgi:hypothetical protein